MYLMIVMDPSGLSFNRPWAINFEPEASALQGQRSAVELRAQFLRIIDFQVNNLFIDYF